jgi:L-methionine (R)-S-oxide reductase
MTSREYKISTPPSIRLLKETRVLENIQAELTSRRPRPEKFEQVAALIREARGYRWVGIYDVTEKEIGAIAWSGPNAPAYPTFPVELGLCGSAVRTGSYVVVSDVTQDARYLTTLDTTRSEIVVPVKEGTTGQVIGLIDVESARVDAFSEDDISALTGYAYLLSAHWDTL